MRYAVKQASPSRDSRRIHPRTAGTAGRLHLLRVAALAAILGVATATIAADAVRGEVPYVPTPQPVVDRMLQVAGVKPSDFVVDLGCGDGRMVVTAASAFGARGLGVDINPVRIQEANDNASRAGVQDKVEFRVGNLFDTDLSQADVLAIYLLPDVNLRLRPKILTTMKPGTRVVSHAFDMGDWKPDLQEKVEGRSVYLWMVPARVDGRWQVREGKKGFDLDLKQVYQEFTGTATIDGKRMPVRNGRLRGTEISFQFAADGGAPSSFHGRVNADRLEAADGNGTTWQARRAGSS